MKVVVGLGNPGAAYERNRHNIGFRCLDLLARRLGWTFARRGNAAIAEGRLCGDLVLLVKPLTFMNLSGEALKRLRRDVSFSPADVLIVYDDLDLPLGVLRVRARGGSGGHRGVASVLEALGTLDVARVRIGIGRPPPGTNVVDYVLEDFAPAEEPLAVAACERAADAIVTVLCQGTARAMERFNRPEVVVQQG
ncbi:MAG TPA: aminoacyl-tRNA hydrolase [Chloroflexota bacterium]